MKALYRRGACELASLIASGEVSSREVVEAHLERIEEVNDHTNAITVVLADSALAAADAADRATKRGPLHGVPFTIKENIDCVGSATTHGVMALQHSFPSQDAPVVERMKAAGAIPIGRTNLPEFGLRLSTSNPLHGATLNPWNPHLTPGGSSGGDAAALATGMTPFGLGNDIGGSLRNPAYCCGIAALKPTLGRIPRASSIEPLDFGASMQYMLVDGPMARKVEDLRMGLDILSGRDIRDPRSVDVPLRGEPPVLPRAALVTKVPGVTIPKVTLETLYRAGKILTEAGWVVEEAEPPEIEEAHRIWGQLFAVDFSVTVPQMKSMISVELYEHMQRMFDSFAEPGWTNYRIHATRSRLIRSWSAFFAQYPVVIGPTWTQLPWPVDADLAAGTGLALLHNTTKFITPGNVLGFPSVALPMDVVDDMPTGIQIYSDLWREDLCLDVAELLESEVDAMVPIDPAW